MSLASRVTIARLWLTGLAFNAIFYEVYLAALVLVILALLSDVLDGHLARKFGQESAIGDKLDHLADLVLLGTLYATLAAKSGLAFRMPVWLASAVVMHVTFQIIAWLLQVVYVKAERKPETPRTGYGKIIFSSQIVMCCLVISANIIPIPYVLLLCLAYCVGIATISHFAVDSFITKIDSDG
jgi:phosphatidylglycerophosphate synthase